MQTNEPADSSPAPLQIGERVLVEGEVESSDAESVDVNLYDGYGQHECVTVPLSAVHVSDAPSADALWALVKRWRDFPVLSFGPAMAVYRVAADELAALLAEAADG